MLPLEGVCSFVNELTFWIWKHCCYLEKKHKAAEIETNLLTGRKLVVGLGIPISRSTISVDGLQCDCLFP